MLRRRDGLPREFGFRQFLGSIGQFLNAVPHRIETNINTTIKNGQITISDSVVGALDHLLRAGDGDPGLLADALLSRRVWVLGAALAVLPLSFHRTLDALRRASALALVFVAALVAVVLSFAFGTSDPCGGDGNADECRGEIEATTDLHSTLASLPVFVFAFTCHQNVFPVVNEMRPPDKLGRTDVAVLVAVTLSLVVFGLVSLGGYSTFGSDTQGDVLLNYPRTGSVTALRLCVAAMLVLHYPLQLDPSRRCVMSLVDSAGKWWNDRRRCRSEAGGSGDDGVEFEGYSEMSKDGLHVEDCRAADTTRGNDIIRGDDKLFRWITISFLVLSVVLALAVDDLGVVLALVGATGSAVVSYVLPGIVYLQICNRSSVLAWAQLVTGLWVMPVALYHVLGRS